jgi:hypothetical protein
LSNGTSKSYIKARASLRYFCNLSNRFWAFVFFFFPRFLIGSCERLKSLANRALDVVEQQLNSNDPKAALAAAKYVLQGTRLLGDTDLPIKGPTTPEEVLLPELQREARQEWEAKNGKQHGRVYQDR